MQKKQQNNLDFLFKKSKIFLLLITRHMSSSLNQVQLIGNMTADAEVKETPNGLKVATFSLATNQVWKDAAGVKQEKTDFHNIVAWKGLADIIEQYTAK